MGERQGWGETGMGRQRWGKIRMGETGMKGETRMRETGMGRDRDEEGQGWGETGMGRETGMGGVRDGVNFHALEQEMAIHSSVLAWRIPGMGEPGRLPSMGSHRVGHD